MSFVPNIRVFKQLRDLLDVAWSTVTSATPFLKYNESTGKIEGAAAPSGGGGNDSRLVSGTTDGQLARWEASTGKWEPYPYAKVNDSGLVTISDPSTGFIKFRFDPTGSPYFGVSTPWADDVATSVNSAQVTTNQFVSTAATSAIDNAGFYLTISAPRIRWASGSYWFQGVDSQLDRVASGRLRVTGADTDTLGGIVQAGVYANMTNPTSTGAITKRIKAYDEAGNLIGYIPVYDTL